MSLPGNSRFVLVAILAVGALVACASGALRESGVNDPTSPLAPEASPVAASASATASVGPDAHAAHHHVHDQRDATAP
jgi:hypothetical protein